MCQKGIGRNLLGGSLNKEAQFEVWALQGTTTNNPKNK